MRIHDLGQMPYRDAWAIQESAHAEVIEGGDERILLVEHPSVITFGRRAGIERNLIASDEQLQTLGVEVVQSDRGGDITFHGSGQLVAYPIIRLIDHALSVGGYVRTLEKAVIDTLAQLGVPARREEGAVGIWVNPITPQGEAAKICAIGVRIRRGATLHGLALNVTTDLRYFNLIVPCGLVGRPVTSLADQLGERVPAFETVKDVLARKLTASFAASKRVPSSLPKTTSTA